MTRRFARQLRESLTVLGANGVELIEQPALDFLAGPPSAFDIVFLDPPFQEDCLAELGEVLSTGWLKPHAKIYLEQAVGTDVRIQQWRQLKERVHGKVRFALYTPA